MDWTWVLYKQFSRFVLLIWISFSIMFLINLKLSSKMLVTIPESYFKQFIYKSSNPRKKILKSRVNSHANRVSNELVKVNKIGQLFPLRRRCPSRWWMWTCRSVAFNYLKMSGAKWQKPVAVSGWCFCLGLVEVYKLTQIQTCWFGLNYQVLV